LQEAVPPREAVAQSPHASGGSGQHAGMASCAMHDVLERRSHDDGRDPPIVLVELNDFGLYEGQREFGASLLSGGRAAW
jgi:hypothetical protein